MRNPQSCQPTENIVCGPNYSYLERKDLGSGVGCRLEENHPVILFDGVCNLCSASVRFVLAHDKDDVFRFASLQSETGRELAKDHGARIDLSTFYLLENGVVYERSDAWLRIMARLGKPWSILAVFCLVPRYIRDLAYDLIGRNRYQWFGKKESCDLPDPEQRHKFI
jgi:predicted DCC family thiol-disulfide oxidoreductase YuxK